MLYQQRESNRLASFCVRSNRCRSRWQLTAARAWTIHRHSLILRRTASSSKAWVESAINIILSLPILLQVIMFSVCCHSFYVNDRLRCKSCAPDRWPDGIVHPIRQHPTTARAACRTWVELLPRIANFFNLGTQIFLFFDLQGSSRRWEMGLRWLYSGHSRSKLSNFVATHRGDFLQLQGKTRRRLLRRRRFGMSGIENWHSTHIILRKIFDLIPPNIDCALQQL